MYQAILMYANINKTTKTCHIGDHAFKRHAFG